MLCKSIVSANSLLHFIKTQDLPSNPTSPSVASVSAVVECLQYCLIENLL